MTGLGASCAPAEAAIIGQIRAETAALAVETRLTESRIASVR
jgi:hypothetical protein